MKLTRSGGDLVGRSGPRGGVGLRRLIVFLMLLLVISMGLALCYYQDYSTVNSQVQSISSQLRYDDSQLQEANAQVTSLNSEVTNLNDTIISLKSHPTLAMWTGCGGNAACPMVSGKWWEEVVPDTFELDISFTSTVPVNVYIFTLPQFVQFYKCGGSVSCVSGTYFSFGPTTSLQNLAFGYGEGCGDYVAIFQSLSDGIFYPDLMVTYIPASTATGACASATG